MKINQKINGYDKGLAILGRRYDNVVVLSADLEDIWACRRFKEEFPDRFIDVSSEANMASIASGMAMEGFVPFIISCAAFSPGRNWEQVRSSVCYPNLNVKIAGLRPGFSNGPNGAAFQGLEDIALARVLPNMKVIAPSDDVEDEKAAVASIGIKGPVYIRFSCRETSKIAKNATFEIGKANVLSCGRDVTIIACGSLVHEALLAAKQLRAKHKIRAEVINSHTIKPLDAKTIALSAKKTGAVVSVEEHQIAGGLGSAVAEILAVRCPVPMRFVGMPDCFGESAERGELIEKYGMAKDKIVLSALDVLQCKDNL